MPLNYSVRNSSRKLKSNIDLYTCCFYIPLNILLQPFFWFLIPIAFVFDLITCGKFGSKNLHIYVGGERDGVSIDHGSTSKA